MVIQAQLERRFVWISRQTAGTSALSRVRQLTALR